MDSGIISKLYTIVDKENVLIDEPMKAHTSFRIGGNADVLINVSRDEITKLIAFCDENSIAYTILGNGSNVLVGDKGIRGVTILIGKRMSDIKVSGDIIEVEAGALLSRTASLALKNSLTGMETLAGIPGSVGGAVLMNAGAYGGEVKDVLLDAEVLNSDGAVVVMQNEELDLSYRHSLIMDEGGIILKARFGLKKGNPDDIRATMSDLSNRRSSKQPLNLPSAGSTFKRPEGYFAGKLIQDSDLMGYRVGGAEVSTKHAGFVVNIDNASASDVRTLIQDVSDKVYSNFGVRLEPEVRFIGEF